MPKQIIHKNFEGAPAYDEEVDLTTQIAETRALLEKELAFVDGIEDTTFQLICIFAMIDRLAQEESNYSADSKNTFCQFVLKHQKRCDYLNEIDPITLYYRVEDLIDEVPPLPGFPPEKEITLDSLGYLYAVRVKDILHRGKAEEILAYIERKKGVSYAERIANDHRLISLLYRMRSKAVHEMSGLGESWRMERKEFKPTEPYYRDVNRSYVINKTWVSDDVIELVIPNVFVRNILADCINGYLSECKNKKRFPFSNNSITRKHALSWYDK